MKTVKIDLPEELSYIEIHTFADEHIGDANCDMKRLEERIEYVKNTPNAFCIMNGDIMDYASRSSIGDIETRNFNIMEQLEQAVKIFSPIKDKILGITTGNHENRSYKKEGIDMSKLIAAQLGLADRYSATSELLFIRFGKSTHRGRKMCYTLYMLHGSGGGKKEGSKLNSLADLAGIVDADVYCHAHTHLPMTMKEAFFRTDRTNSTVSCVEKLFVNNAANLDYGGYGEAQQFKPASKTSPIIYLNGKKREMSATL